MASIFLQVYDLCVIGSHWSSFMVVVLEFQIKLWFVLMGCSKSLSWILTSRFLVTLLLGGDLASRFSESFTWNIIDTRFEFCLLGLLGYVWNLSLLGWFGKNIHVDFGETWNLWVGRIKIWVNKDTEYGKCIKLFQVAKW